MKTQFVTGIKDVPKAIYVLAPCRVVYTSNSVLIKSKKFGTFLYSASGDQLTPAEMNFVRYFRDHHFKNSKGLKYNRAFLERKARFVHFNTTRGKYTNVVEIDINNAYPTAGYVLGIINDEWFAKMSAMSKKTGLIAIGTLHRRRKTISVSGSGKRKLINQEELVPHLSDLWKSMTNYTDYAVRHALDGVGKKGYFYWCDAIFCDASAVPSVTKTLSKYGFDYKTQSLKSLSFEGSHAVTTDKAGKKKLFRFPQQKPTVEESVEKVANSYKTIQPNLNA